MTAGMTEGMAGMTEGMAGMTEGMAGMTKVLVTTGSRNGIRNPIQAKKLKARIIFFDAKGNLAYNLMLWAKCSF